MGNCNCQERPLKSTSSPGRTIYDSNETSSDHTSKMMESSDNSIEGDKRDEDVIVFTTKPQSSQVDMFLRAKNREFYGMTEDDGSKWQGDYDFVCMGDPQLGMGDQEKEEEFSRQAVKFINGKKPKFVVVCGDLTNNLEAMWSNGDLEGGRKKRLEELVAYKKIYSKLDADIPLVCVCGNHDVGNKPTNETIKLYTDEFGDDYLTFWSGGVKFVVMNSQILALEDSDKLSIAHAKWLDEELTRKHRNPPEHLVVICHIPPFCWDIEEDNSYFNWPKEKREIWLDKMVDAKVKKIYCSHYHRRSGGSYNGLDVVVSAPIGTNILTKSLPTEIEGSRLDEINYRLSWDSFGGTETSEKTSGLHVVTVTREGLTEEWLSITKINQENSLIEEKSR